MSKVTILLNLRFVTKICFCNEKLQYCEVFNFTENMLDVMTYSCNCMKFTIL